jgi:hypothetical protein
LLPRILASYYFVQQLIDEGKFDPKDSIKKGAGGAPFPFSLIYNALGYGSIKEWVGFGSESAPNQRPIPKDKIDAATDLVDFLFGRKSKDAPAVIQDSRQLKWMSRIAGDKASIIALKRGEPIEKVAKRLDPVSSQLQEGLDLVRSTLEEMLAIATGQKINQDERIPLLPPAEAAVRLASSLYQQLSAPPDLGLPPGMNALPPRRRRPAPRES